MLSSVGVKLFGETQTRPPPVVAAFLLAQCEPDFSRPASCKSEKCIRIQVTEEQTENI